MSSLSRKEPQVYGDFFYSVFLGPELNKER